MQAGEILIYQAPDGSTSIDVKLENETVWLSQDQMAHLFDKAKSTINEHIKNIYSENELQEKDTKRKFGNSEFSDKPTNYYNLDVIISVGYRVKSPQGTQFRIWANKILKDYLIKGYAVNEKRLQEQKEQLKQLKQTVKLLGNVLEAQPLSSDEATGLLKIITDYTYALDVLDKYDHQVLEIHDTTKQNYSGLPTRKLYGQSRGKKTNSEAAHYSEMKRTNLFKALLLQFIKLLAGNMFIPV